MWEEAFAAIQCVSNSNTKGEEEMQEINYLKRHRWSGLWNGVVIGMGVAWLLLGQPIGLLPVGLGIGLEWTQRKRLDKAG